MTGHEFALALFAGVALALPYLFYAARAREARRLFAAGLVVAACIYVLFAAAAGTKLLMEIGGVAVFGILAYVGVRHSVYVLALGWVAHVAWDLLLHPSDWWYPVACIGFDLVVAGAILGMAWRRGLPLSGIMGR